MAGKVMIDPSTDRTIIANEMLLRIQGQLKTTMTTEGDIAHWLKHTLGVQHLYPKQDSIARSLQEHNQVSVLGCNSSGKDFLAARLALWWCRRYHPAKVIITGPTHRQIQDIIWQEIRIAYANAGGRLGGRLYQTPLLRWGPEQFIIGFSTDRPYQLQGFHSPNLLVIVTEAHGVAQPHYDALWRLNPRAILLTGNPVSVAGEFYESHHNQAHLWQTHVITAWDTPNIIEGEVVIPGLVTQEDIDRGAERWGEDSPLYRITFKSEWVEDMGQTIIVPLRLAQAAEQAWEAGAYPLSGVEVVACDVARFGTDKTVIYSRTGRVACILWRTQGAPTTEIADWLDNYHRQKPHIQIVVDGVGVGGGVIDQLRARGIGVIEFQGGGGADDSQHFADRNAEVWWRMREAYEAGMAIYPDSETRSQVSSRRYTVQADKRIRLESKDDMKKNGRHSPDEGDALAMTFALHWSVGPRLQAGSDADRHADELHAAAQRGSLTIEGKGLTRGPAAAGSRWGKLRGGYRRSKA